jgi:dTDP-4-amino-4,6-dideoxygalactose transaminase
MKVPFLDLKRQYAQLKEQLDEAVQSVIDSQMFILGSSVSKFEEELAEYCGTKFAVGCSSGTDALILSLLAAGIGKGDEVITSPFTFFATAEAIIRVGAKPVFVDIRVRTPTTLIQTESLRPSLHRPKLSCQFTSLDSVLT